MVMAFVTVLRAAALVGTFVVTPVGSLSVPAFAGSSQAFAISVASGDMKANGEVSAMVVGEAAGHPSVLSGPEPDPDALIMG
jgi:hypothetical protein